MGTAMIDPASTPPTVRLLTSLLPATWRDRGAVLRAAARLDEQHAEGLRVVLAAWDRWRRQGVLPTPGPLLDVVSTLVELLGGVAHELRRRPRAPMPGSPATKTPPPHRVGMQRVGER